jgi:hypothetical protein
MIRILAWSILSIGLLVSGGVAAKEEPIGTNILLDPHASDERVKTELKRIYSKESNHDLKETLNHLEQLGFSCKKPTARDDYDFWCDHKGPFPLNTKDGVFIIEFRRQLLLAPSGDSLRIYVHSSTTAP